jgi:hypothetical protein
MSESNLGRYNKRPVLRVQKAEVSNHYIVAASDTAKVQNASKALNFIRERGVKLTNIGTSAPFRTRHADDQAPKTSSTEI